MQNNEMENNNASVNKLATDNDIKDDKDILDKIENYNLIELEYNYTSNKNIISIYKKIVINNKFKKLLSNLIKDKFINKDIIDIIHKDFYKEISYITI
jgi:hypothetical protein